MEKYCSSFSPKPDVLTDRNKRNEQTVGDSGLCQSVYTNALITMCYLSNDKRTHETRSKTHTGCNRSPVDKDIFERMLLRKHSDGDLSGSTLSNASSLAFEDDIDYQWCSDYKRYGSVFFLLVKIMLAQREISWEICSQVIVNL
jgi:hypothetical protein